MRRIASRAGLAVIAIALAPVALSTVSLGPSTAVAQEPVREDSLAVIEGTVVAEGSERPLSRANVELLGQRRRATADTLGRFRLAELVPGPDTLRVTHLDFRSDPLAVVIAPDGRYRVELAVAYPLATLEELVVEVRSRRAERMRGFERRRRAGMGSYIGREEIERARPIELSWMLRRLSRVRKRAGGRVLFDTRGVTGLALQDARSITGEAIRVMRDTGTCRPTIFLDGEPQDSLTEVDDIRPEEVAGIEVYHSPFVPARFSDFLNECGSIVIWRRLGFAPS